MVFHGGITMFIKSIIDEDFVNYKKTSMFIGTSSCTWKCCKEGNFDIQICQNSQLAKQKDFNVSYDYLYKRYINNHITKSVVLGGLEPFDQFEDVFNLIKTFRENNCLDDFVIYTGYYEHEIGHYIKELSKFDNIYVKFGRYIPNSESIYDEILGINLASKNQYCKKI